MVKGVNQLSGLEVNLYYKINNKDYVILPMKNSKEYPNQYTSEIPTQGPDTVIRYYISVEGDGILLSSPAQPFDYRFEIIPLPESIPSSSEIVAMIFMMIVIMGFFWGGFGYASFLAMRAEQRKLHEYRYGEYSN
jgi:hypothetical protein